jgi:hypothetical protein
VFLRRCWQECWPASTSSLLLLPLLLSLTPHQPQLLHVGAGE